MIVSYVKTHEFSLACYSDAGYPLGHSANTALYNKIMYDLFPKPHSRSLQDFHFLLHLFKIVPKDFFHFHKEERRKEKEERVEQNYHYLRTP